MNALGVAVVGLLLKSQMPSVSIKKERTETASKWLLVELCKELY